LGEGVPSEAREGVRRSAPFHVFEPSLTALGALLSAPYSLPPVTPKLFSAIGAFPIAFKIIPKASIGLPGASKGLPFVSKNFISFPGIEDYQWLTGERRQKNRRRRCGADRGRAPPRRAVLTREHAFRASPARAAAYPACAACPRPSWFSPSAARLTLRRAFALLRSRLVSLLRSRRGAGSPRTEHIMNYGLPVVKKIFDFFVTPGLVSAIARSGC
jgi:hypothetical protein